MLHVEAFKDDCLSILKALPGNFLVLQADAPRFTILHASDNYIQCFNTEGETITGTGLFDHITDNLPSPAHSGLHQSLDHVIEHASAHCIKVENYTITNHSEGSAASKCLQISHTPVPGTDGRIRYIIHSVETAAEEMPVEYAPKKFEAGVKLIPAGNNNSSIRHLTDQPVQIETNLRNIILQAPVAMCILKGSSFIVEIANARMFELWGRNREELINRPIFEGLPEAAKKGLEEILYKVYTTGETFSASDFPVMVPRKGEPVTLYVNFVYEPVKEDDGTITGIIAIALDVTEQVITRKKLEESEMLLQEKVAERTASLEQQNLFINTLLEASFNGIYSLKAIRNEAGEIIDFLYLYANSPVARFLNRDINEIIGNSVLTLVPETRTNIFFDSFCRVAETGEAISDETLFVLDNLDYWFNYNIVKSGHDMLVVTLQDITKQKNTLSQIEQQRNLLDKIMQHSPSGISVSEMIRDGSGVIIDAHTIIANATSTQFTMVPLDMVLTKKVSEIDPGILSSPLFRQALDTLGTGKPFMEQYYLEPTGRWLEVSVAKMDENRLINIFTDVTRLKNIQLEIEKSEERLKAVFNNAQSGMFTFTPVLDETGEIIDFRFVITNYYFAAYVNQSPEILNGDLGSKWFPGYLHNGVFDMYRQTFLTGETLRMDKHYYVDGLDLYLDLKSTRVGGEVLVTFIDHTPLKTAQVQMEKYVDELKKSNANLEDFAYAASHDLKEPVRKIRVFSDRVQTLLGEKLSTEELHYFLLIEKATVRMQNLIDDLLEYSHIAAPMNYLDNIDLNKKVTQVLEDLELEITEKKANIIVGKLPVINGHRRQIQQLFQNLISNALKFCKPGVPPDISISSSVIVAGKPNALHYLEGYDNTLYNEIVVSDNGIGFQQEYSDIIFKMFQRLHGQSEFEGTGIGLAIVRKVVENHKGFITAVSKPGQGATFRILFPIK